MLSAAPLGTQLHGKITATQIDEGVHARYHKFHGVDALGNGREFQHPGGRHGGIGGGQIKQL